MERLKVPAALRPIAAEIIELTDAVCASLLDEEYAALARQAVAQLARKRPSPLVSGTRKAWAGGVLYALGQVNFLFDSATRPHVTADQLAQAVAVAKSTMSAKAKLIRDRLKIDHFSGKYQRADMLARNPLIWMVMIDGLLWDVRQLPVEVQIAAYQQGVIPYVPAHLAQATEETGA
jgi:Domain of unknown function (DUF6398)